MNSDSATENLARRLWEARRDGRSIPLGEDERPRDAGEAYAVQRAISEACGLAIVGFKIGATARQAMELLGVDGPFFAPMYEGRFRSDGASVPLPTAHSPGVEAEFAVVLERDLPPRDAPWTFDEVQAAVGAVAPGLEIVGSRLEGGLAGAGVLAIADGGANIDFVRGPLDGDWRGADLGSHPVTLRINGEEIASGDSGMLIFGNPIAGVEWLANHPEIAPRGLKAGDTVTTGTCTGIRPLAPGDEVEADYGTLGKVRALCR